MAEFFAKVVEIAQRYWPLFWAGTKVTLLISLTGTMIGLAIGLVTPPVGMCLNACNKINRMPIIAIFKGALPYLICNIIVLLAISLWGPLTTWLPLMLGYSL